MIFIIGTDHGLQHGLVDNFDTEEIETFIDYLRGVIWKENIKLAAEETSVDGKDLYHCQQTCLEIAATDLGVKHIMCDPGRKERQHLGVVSRQELALSLGIQPRIGSLTRDEELRINKAARPYDLVRENYWLDSIKKEMSGNTLILIGYDHVDTFKAVLDRIGIKNTSFPVYQRGKIDP